MKKAEVILHPIRMRIIQLLTSGRRMTAQQLQDELRDVPQATLYRHLKKLLESGVLVVAEEIPVRGTVEKVYALPKGNAHVKAEDLAGAGPEEHVAYFMQFASHLIGEFGRYANQPGLDLEKDGVSYRTQTLYLTDEENLRLLLAIRGLIAEAAKNGPGEGRKSRLFAVIGFPNASDSQTGG